MGDESALNHLKVLEEHQIILDKNLRTTSKYMY